VAGVRLLVPCRDLDQGMLPDAVATCHGSCHVLSAAACLHCGAVGSASGHGSEPTM
jgi:hypothetical protein